MPHVGHWSHLCCHGRQAGLQRNQAAGCCADFRLVLIPAMCPHHPQVILWALSKLGHKAGTPQLPTAFVADMVQRVSGCLVGCLAVEA